MTIDAATLREGADLGVAEITPDPEQVQRHFVGSSSAPTFFSDDAAAKAQGLPGKIVPGPFKVGILYGFVSRWLGNAGWVVAVRAAHRRPDLQGRTVTVVGSVARLYEEQGKRRADLELQIINEEGQPSVRGFATVEFWVEG